ncbi:MAG: glycerol-3-phosphate responsive antiterminator [Hungatella hathewayi]|jgi:glycerol uptake operon antiterminator|uniref:Glycerol-3-phosphate responsive antiterminator n=4 Tax=Hungatella TaxID=1649459 RepID=A0A3E4TV85_9FIRM|nr:glycerol-3-phosphate responsive antiterminator [Hungatella hominis]MBS5075606.1 glycerol-3-phosphate responsive antiterminator [Hungatella hathewayi]RGL95502.1 glycerol-3-phosphate responsive antiterminator [Hungatella hathewayi]RGO66090.1 glycerol-3-phosphate responsive antiterminator [Hungatella hathewayi]RHM82639.1 glycerol-3-phosphate responsive antiterminator [Hungatella hathewayi]
MRGKKMIDDKKRKFRVILEDCPVIAAVKDETGLKECLYSESQIIFLLFGDICSVGRYVEIAKSAGKMVFVHMDLINGLGNKEVAVDFIREHTGVDGIISTKPQLVKRAKELGLFGILRIFVIDSMAFGNIEKQCASLVPDAVEILPGLMPKIIKKLCSTVNVPIIAGGLISDKEDVMNALNAGAVAISVTNQRVWFM